MKIKTTLAMAVAVLAVIACKQSEMKPQKAYIGPSNIEITDGHMTPEVLLSLGRLSDPQLSPDGKTILYGVSYTSIEENRSVRNLFTIPVEGGDPTSFYSILRYFREYDVTPVYSVVENPELTEPFITVSLLYSRKPDELVNDFNSISQKHAHAKAKKTVEQFRELEKLDVNMEREAIKVVKEKGTMQNDILDALRRIGKL